MATRASNETTEPKSLLNVFPTECIRVRLVLKRASPRVYSFTIDFDLSVARVTFSRLSSVPYSTTRTRGTLRRSLLVVLVVRAAIDRGRSLRLAGEQ